MVVMATPIAQTGYGISLISLSCFSQIPLRFLSHSLQVLHSFPLSFPLMFRSFWLAQAGRLATAVVMVMTTAAGTAGVAVTVVVTRCT